MNQYIGIIRGINVGGHNKVNMKMLREALEEHKFKQVRTYIQSGNIVFQSGATSIPSIEKRLSKILHETFDVQVPVLVRTKAEWQKTINLNPFLEQSTDYTKLCVAFLSVKPSPVDVKAVSQMQFPHDEFVIKGKDVYMYCKEGFGKTDIPNAFFEKKLKVTATARNWRTVLELGKMLDV